MDTYQRRAEAFGCTAAVIDGHDITQIDQALAAARDAERLVVALARTVKPADQATLADADAATGGRLVIAEGHYPQGGLGAAVLEALAGAGLPLRVRQCAVGGLPGSGTPGELMEAAGISASRIAAAARDLLKRLKKTGGSQ